MECFAVHTISTGKLGLPAAFRWTFIEFDQMCPKPPTFTIIWGKKASKVSNVSRTIKSTRTVRDERIF